MSHFDVTIAQSRAWRILSRSVGLGRVGQAYLIYGADGLGHWPLAVRFAALLNCERTLPDKNDPLLRYPCGECDHCRTILDLNFPDFLPVVPIRSAKSAGDPVDLINEALQARKAEPYCRQLSKERVSISIDAVRRVKSILSRRCESGIHRVVLFDRIEKMLPVALDALLKTLEEPPKNTTIILTTDSPDMLASTIHSRCRKVRLSASPLTELSGYLQSRFGLDENQARRIAHIAEGNPGRAIGLVGQDEDQRQAARIKGFRLFRSLFESSRADTVAGLIESLPGNDHSRAEELLTLWQTFVRDCAYFGASADESGIVNSDFQKDICSLGDYFDRTGLAPVMISSMKNTLADLRRNVHIHTALAALSLELGGRVRAAR